MKRNFRQVVRLSAPWLVCLTLGNAYADDGGAHSAEPRSELAAEIRTVIDAASKYERPPAFVKRWSVNGPARLYDGLSISADGSRVFASLQNGSSVILSGDTGEVVSQITESLGGKVTASALSASGKLAAVGTSEGGILLIDVSTGKILHRHDRTKDRIIAVAISTDDKYITSVDEKGNARRHEARTNEPGRSISIGGLDQFVGKVCISFDGLLVLASGAGRHTLNFASFAGEGKTGTQGPIELPHPVRNFACSANHVMSYDVSGDDMLSAHPVAHEGNKLQLSSQSHLPADPRMHHWLAISGDEKLAMAVGRGQVELRAFDVFDASSVHVADFEHAIQAAIAPDVRRFVVVDAQGRISLHELPDVYLPPAWSFMRQITQWVKDRDYTRLNELATALEEDPDPFYWMPRYSKHEIMRSNVVRIDTLFKKPMKWMDVINDWLEKSPGSRCPRISKGFVHISRAWQARGDGFANTVSEKGWRVFHDELETARSVLLELVREEKPAPLAYYFLFELAKGEGWSKEECDGFSEALLKQAPRFFQPHCSLMTKKLMRWGGRPDEAEEYARRVADFVGGEDGDTIYARMTLEISSYETGDILFGPMGFDAQRIKRGWQHLQKREEYRDFALTCQLLFCELERDRSGAGEVCRQMDELKASISPNVANPRAVFDTLYQKYHDEPVKPRMAAPPQAPTEISQFEVTR